MGPVRSAVQAAGGEPLRGDGRGSRAAVGKRPRFQAAGSASAVRARFLPRDG